MVFDNGLELKSMAKTRKQSSATSETERSGPVYGNGRIDAYNIYVIGSDGKADLIAARFDLEDATALLRECEEWNPPPKIVMAPIYLAAPFSVELSE